jgi:carbon starvation protein
MLNFLNTHLHNGMVLMIGVLLVLAIAYRYYSAFIAAKVLALDPARTTPAHTLHDGQNYHPTNKWVLFGHHFAAISGAGPLIGPVLAAQYGYLPGLLWILIGVCLAGAVQDFVVLGLSTRRNGKSLAQIAYLEVGTVAGTAATIGILFVLIIALAGLGKVVVQALGGETVAYPVGTRFEAGLSPIVPELPGGNISRYRIPAGTTVIYPTGAKTSVGHQFTLESHPAKEKFLVDIEVRDPKKLGGSLLVVPPDNITTRAIRGSSWGTFTIALTIPIALLVGLYLTRFRKGKVLEASIIGGVLTLGAVWLGGQVDDPNSFMNAFQEYFDLTRTQIAIAMALYGFVAAVLPVSVLLCPRDYLSSFLKIGTIALLVVGVILAQPTLQAPAINDVFLWGGPTVKGSIFPFLFIIIMCGAVSGFHALVASGTTPKMVNNEKDTRMIGYGAMLIEGLVGIVALIAAASIPTAHYYHMNTAYNDLPTYQQTIVDLAKQNDKPGPGEKEVQPLSAIESRVGENLEGRTGGAVTLAVGMAKIFDDAAKKILGTGSQGVAWLESMMKYWYHFAIMFEALFILTTIDTGTRVGRFLLQETMGKWIHPSLGKTAWWPSTLLSTALVVGGWFYFIDSKSMEAIWPMFGISNQMLAVMALCIATVAIIRSGRGRYAWVTLAPMFVVTITTMSAAAVMLRGYFTQVAKGFEPAAKSGAWINPMVSAILILAIVICTVTILLASFIHVRRPMPPTPEPVPVPEKEVPTLG